MIPTQQTIEKLRKLQRYIQEEPRRFNLKYWGMSCNPDNYGTLEVEEGDEDFTETLEKQRPPCGTIGCLAGSICIIEGLIRPRFIENVSIYKFPYDTSKLAEVALGISEKDADKLFLCKSWFDSKFGWPDEFAEELELYSPGSKEYADVAVRRIDHYIETGE